MIDYNHSLLIILVAAAVTFLIRALPFILFRGSTPASVVYLSNVLHYAIMGMLVVYCLKSTPVLESPHGLPEMISVTLIIVLHKWKHNTLLSIVSGTVVYMLLIQLVFA